MAHHDHDDDKVTTGEIYRRLCDMDDRYEKKLDQIEVEVRTTNSRTTTLEAIVKDHGRDLGRLTSAVFPRPHAPADDGESLTVKISPKLWVALAAAGGMLFPVLVEWVGKVLAR